VSTSQEARLDGKGSLKRDRRKYKAWLSTSCGASRSARSADLNLQLKKHLCGLTNLITGLPSTVSHPQPSINFLVTIAWSLFLRSVCLEYPAPAWQTHLILYQQRCSCHLCRLLQAHRCQDSWCYVSEDAILLLQRPALRRVRHDEGDLVGRVRRLGRAALFHQHLFSVTAMALAQAES